jgi:hypothetical protein
MDNNSSALQPVAMKSLHALAAVLVLPLSACLNNPTIDEEIADKCGISVAEYQKADASLARSHDGASLQAGRCRLTRRTKDVTDGTVVDGS